jgi:hypothetical protein
MCGACGGSTLLNTDPNNFLTSQILATKDSKNALPWIITQRVVVIS